MSRAYRISVTEAIRRHIKVHDGVQVQLDLLPILCPERMGELLWSELAGLGFDTEDQRPRRAVFFLQSGPAILVWIPLGGEFVAGTVKFDPTAEDQGQHEQQ